MSWWPWSKKKEVEPQKESDSKAVKSGGLFSTDLPVVIDDLDKEEIYAIIEERSFVNNPADMVPTGKLSQAAMDTIDSTKNAFGFGFQTMPPQMLAYYSSQTFIGYQACAILAQNWLINKACTVPAKDAVRNGFEIARSDGEELETDFMAKLKRANKRYRLDQNLVEFEKMNRTFGIRIAMFKVASSDPLYYEKPFNVDNVKKGSYIGISQVDPYWISPELDYDAVANPSSVYFYEPTYWRIAGRRVHRSHLVITRYSEVTDVLKPTYLYGGLPLTQLIYERVYAAERTANEAPVLAMTKRLTVLSGVDMDAMSANEVKLSERMLQWSRWRDNHGIKVCGGDEQISQHDTTLTDLDTVIMTQYQIVAAVANIPATKLLGTSPKGFNATGEFESRTYYDELESIQTDSLEPLVVRHMELLLRSEFDEKFEFDVIWNPVHSPSAKEKADLNKSKADTAKAFVEVGALDGYDVRKSIIEDEDSGYAGLEPYDEEDRFNDSGEGEGGGGEKAVQQEEEETGTLSGEEKDVGKAERV